MVKKIIVLFLIVFSTGVAFSQTIQKALNIKKAVSAIKIDGNLDEADWKNAAEAKGFIEFQPTPFIPEDPADATKVYLLYDNLGLYVGGICNERTRDSISTELIGRDNFGNNDFAGIIFDTYKDKLNGFGYFITPLGEQMDAKYSPSQNGNNEDFSWNAVWKSAAKVKNDGWCFEMFIPYSAIRFGKKKIQNWGFNIIRHRRKCSQKLFWNSIDPNQKGFLAQAGELMNLENIKPPVRLQLSPYLSTYVTHDGLAESGTEKTSTAINGGMDVKYGINQAFTLDMTLIPDFGQVQSDNRVLNTGPFEQQYSENRAFFTEGTDLFNKGNLFYSRRIGAQPIHYYDAYSQTGTHEFIRKNPAQSKIVNATKISGRTQKGWGVGILNAITSEQFAVIEDSLYINKPRKFETDPLTNYNVFVLDKTLRNNSSVSFVNTNVLRSGSDYDANVSALLFDFNDKKNKWNIGGNVGTSVLFLRNGKTQTGYSHSIYMGKTSGKFTFNVWQDLVNDKYDKNDLGYFTNNNSMDQGVWMGYSWNKPQKWYNRMSMNVNGWYSRLVTPLDPVKGWKRMFQGGGINYNFNAQTKKLWSIGLNLNAAPDYNDFYEARISGRVFANKGRFGGSVYWNSNNSKKLSWGGSLFSGMGGVFKRISLDYSVYGKVRFSSKFSVDLNVNTSNAVNNPGFAFISGSDVIFSRRNLNTVSNTLNIKYSFTNKMGVTLTAVHNWTKINPQQLYLLNSDGSVSPTANYNLNLDGTVNTPSGLLTTANGPRNVNQNYNYLAVDMVYTWQFAQGSFLNIGWKNIGESFNRSFESNYLSNLDKTSTGKNLNSTDLNSLSLKIIYFLDYLSLKKKHH